MIQAHRRVVRRPVLGLTKLAIEILTLSVGKIGPRRAGSLAANCVDFNKMCKRFFQVESCVAHQHVDELDELVEIVAGISLAEIWARV